MRIKHNDKEFDMELTPQQKKCFDVIIKAIENDEFCYIFFTAELVWGRTWLLKYIDNYFKDKQNEKSTCKLMLENPMITEKSRQALIDKINE